MNYQKKKLIALLKTIYISSGYDTFFEKLGIYIQDSHLSTSTYRGISQAIENSIQKS